MKRRGWTGREEKEEDKKGGKRGTGGHSGGRKYCGEKRRKESRGKVREKRYKKHIGREKAEEGKLSSFTLPQ